MLVRLQSWAFLISGAIFFLYVKCLAGEGKFNAFCFEALHDLEIDPLVHFLIKPVIGRLEVDTMLFTVLA